MTFNLTSKKKKTIFLFFSQIFSLSTAFITNMFLAKMLGAKNFGTYALCLSIISFFSIFYEFGFFASSARLLAQVSSSLEEKKLIGASLIVFFFIAFSFIFTILVVAFLTKKLYGKEISNILKSNAIVSWALIVPFFLDLICKGTNKIELLSIFNFLWRILFLVFIFLLYFFKLFKPAYILFSFCISILIVFIFVILRLSPSFKGINSYLKEIFQEFKKYGIHIYIGRVIDVSTYQLDRLLLGYFATPKDVGFYSLATSMATPINTFSSALASTKFKDFASGKLIAKKLLLINFFWIVFSIISVNIFGYLVINYYLGKEYENMFIILIIMSFAVGFQAAYQLYNAWLASNGYGRILKKMSLFMASINFLGIITLIPFLFSLGAALGSVLGTFTYFIISYYYYNKVKEEHFGNV